MRPEYVERQRLLGLLPLTLEVQVTADALRLELSGPLAFLSKTIPGDRIGGVRIRDGIIMRPFGHWGLFSGIGVRIAAGFGRVYNFGHRRGVSVEMTDHRRVVVGSENPERLAAALQRHVGSNA